MSAQRADAFRRHKASAWIAAWVGAACTVQPLSSPEEVSGPADAKGDGPAAEMPTYELIAVELAEGVDPATVAWADLEDLQKPTGDTARLALTQGCVYAVAPLGPPFRYCPPVVPIAQERETGIVIGLTRENPRGRATRRLEVPTLGLVLVGAMVWQWLVSPEITPHAGGERLLTALLEADEREQRDELAKLIEALTVADASELHGSCKTLNEMHKSGRARYPLLRVIDGPVQFPPPVGVPVAPRTDGIDPGSPVVVCDDQGSRVHMRPLVLAIKEPHSWQQGPEESPRGYTIPAVRLDFSLAAESPGVTLEPTGLEPSGTLELDEPLDHVSLEAKLMQPIATFAAQGESAGMLWILGPEATKLLKEALSNTSAGYLRGLEAWLAG